ncbi:DUF1127 domain-containing protein [Pseudogemmobacter sp. W21_MBD1_M6]|uniref:DUF1127 domain-containing protein n=1 Tax=Pseudogemmobacter sp. W21_MBD1_M6 TaxID=3240271 RepID=UPI003F99B883
MSHALHASQIAILNRSHPLPVLARAAMVFAVTVTKWDMNRRTRRALARLDDHMLDDIGIGRGAALAEVSRPFWRD